MRPRLASLEEAIADFDNTARWICTAKLRTYTPPWGLPLGVWRMLLWSKRVAKNRKQFGLGHEEFGLFVVADGLRKAVIDVLYNTQRNKLPLIVFSMSFTFFFS